MEKEVKKVAYLGRGIHNKKFAESLMNGKLRQMLIAISNDKDTYSIYRSKTASYDIKSHWLKIYDCTLERFFWNPSYASTENPSYHKNISVNFAKGWIVVADSSSN